MTTFNRAMTAKKLLRDVVEAEEALKQVQSVYDAFNDAFSTVITAEYIEYDDATRHYLKKGLTR